jgi:glycerophosphoryl diester phosphodiesterase
MRRPLITAHRGYSRIETENTIPAFASALNHECDRIEFDLHLSKDRQLVVHHDYCFKANFGETRAIFETAYNEMPNEIPRLSDVLDVVGTKAELEIELKGSSCDFVDTVLKAIEEAQVIDKVEFTSPHPYVLSYLRSRRTDIKLGMFVAPFPEWMTRPVGHHLVLSGMDLGMIDVAHCPLSILDEEFVAQLHRSGKLVHAANCNSASEIERAITLKVDQFSTDELELAVRVRKRLWEEL